MIPSYMQGTASLSFPIPVYIQSCASIVSQKEAEGPLGTYFDMVCPDPKFGEDTWEASESTLQKDTALLAIQKSGLSIPEIRLAFAGDLLAQTSASSFGVAGMGIPFYGLFGACSTMGEALSLGAMAVSAGYASHVLCATSSHFATAEKEFRFPLGYGSQRPASAAWTVTGSGACVLGDAPPALPVPGQSAPLRTEKGCAVIQGLTTGKLIDFGLKDSLNMGACMAPAACETIWQNLSDFGRTPDDYDCIFTGDLGTVGQRILQDLLFEKGIDISRQHQDCGMLIYDSEAQDTHAGGSGCGCAASVLASYILPGVADGKWNRVLFVPTGALLSKVSFNEGDTIPGIAHAVIIEHREVQP